MITIIFRQNAALTYNLQMEHDKTLIEFVQILGHIKELIGDTANLDDEDLDLAKAIQQLRLTGNDKDADELARLVQRADELKVQQQQKS